MLIGLVGKPSAGKSTFFKAATLMDVAIANYPFTTIKPNEGVTHISIERVDKNFSVKSAPRVGYCKGDLRFVPVKIMDVAGLVPGAHEGKGMGNQFLDDLRQADAFIHVIDISGSTNEKGDNVSLGSYDPGNDIKFLEDELDHWFFGILKKKWAKFSRTVEQTKKELYKEVFKQFSGLKISEEQVRKALVGFDQAQPSKWRDDDLFKFAAILRKTKPIIIAANKLDKSNGKTNLERIKKQFPEYTIIGCSAEVELALKEASNKKIIKYVPGSDHFEILKSDLPDKLKQGLEFMKKFLDEFKSTGVQEVIDTIVFDMLEYIPIFPGGIKGLKDSKGRTLPDCFLLPKGSTALDFAYFIHTDIGDKFVKAIDVRTKKPLGKNHPLKSRDIIEIMTS